MTVGMGDAALISRAVACVLKALPEHKQTPENIAAIRYAIAVALTEGTRGELDLAQIGVLAVD